MPDFANQTISLDSIELRVLRNALRHEWDNLQQMKTAEGVKVAGCKPEARAEYQTRWDRYDAQQKATERLLARFGAAA